MGLVYARGGRRPAQGNEWDLERVGYVCMHAALFGYSSVWGFVVQPANTTSEEVNALPKVWTDAGPGETAGVTVPVVQRTQHLHVCSQT